MLDLPEESGERVDEALKYVDFVVGTLLRYQKNMSPKRIRSLIKEGESNWVKLVNKGLVVDVDKDDGAKLYLDSINFAEMFISRVLGSAGSDEEYKILLNISRNVAEFMGWGKLDVIESGE
jgi:hypothetical protein